MWVSPLWLSALHILYLCVCVCVCVCARMRVNWCRHTIDKSCNMHHISILTFDIAHLSYGIYVALYTDIYMCSLSPFNTFKSLEQKQLQNSPRIRLVKIILDNL